MLGCTERGGAGEWRERRMPDARTGCSRWTSTSWWGGALVGSPSRGRSPNDASLTHLDDALSNLLAIKKGLQVG